MASTQNKFSRYALWLIFSVYSAILVKVIVVKNTNFFINSLHLTWRYKGYHKSSATQNWEPFKNIKILLYGNVTLRTSLENLGGNIILFIPFGIMVPMLLKGNYKANKTIGLGFLLSSFFEFFQLFTGCGQFDVDDIILNTFGSIVGVAFYTMTLMLFPAHKSVTR